MDGASIVDDFTIIGQLNDRVFTLSFGLSLAVITSTAPMRAVPRGVYMPPLSDPTTPRPHH